MAEVEFNGSQGTVPDFAMEDTQAKILAELKKQFKLDTKAEQNAKNAMNAENKNSKAQLEAFKKLSGDISDAMDGKGSMLGSLGKAAGGVTSVFSGLLGPVAKVTGSITAVGLALGSLALDITRGLGDELKGAGLVETGAAFGALGQELPTLVPKFQTMGLSVDAAAGAVQNFRAAMTQLGAGGGSAVSEVVKQFQQMTNSGAKFGMTIQENIEYLANEIDYRQRMGYIQRGLEQQQADLALESLESQIKASKLLGKSVEDIRDGVRGLFSTSQAQAFYARMGAVNQNTIENMFNTLDGGGISDSLQNSIMAMINDPNFLQSPEAQELFNDIGLIGGEAADQVKTSMENLRRAMLNKDDQEGIRKAAKAFEEDMLGFASSIKGINDVDQRMLRMYNREGVLDFLAAQNLATTALERYRTIVEDPALARSIQLSTEFDNQIEQLKAVIRSIETTLQSAFAPMLSHFVGLLGKASDENSPLGKFSIDVERISARFIVAMNKLLGTEEDAAKEGEESKDGLTVLFDSLASAIDGVLETILGATQDWQKISAQNGGDFLETLKVFFIGNILMPLGNALIDAVAYLFDNVDIVDILMGNSDTKSIKEAKAAVSDTETMLLSKGIATDSNEYKQAIAEAKKDALDIILERASDREYTGVKTLDMIEKAGLKDENIENLSANDLAEIFPSATDLVEAGSQGKITEDQFVTIQNKLIDRLGSHYSHLMGYNRSQGLLNDMGAVNFVAPEPEKKIEVSPEETNAQLIKMEVDRLTKALEGQDIANIDQDALNKQVLENLQNVLEYERTNVTPEVNPSDAIMKDTTDTSTDEESTSQDGTKTSEVKKADGESSGANNMSPETMTKFAEEIGKILGPALQDIAKSTKKTASATNATASNTS